MRVMAGGAGHSTERVEGKNDVVVLRITFHIIEFIFCKTGIVEIIYSFFQEVFLEKFTFHGGVAAEAEEMDGRLELNVLRSVYLRVRHFRVADKTGAGEELPLVREHLLMRAFETPIKGAIVAFKTDISFEPVRASCQKSRCTVHVIFPSMHLMACEAGHLAVSQSERFRDRCRVSQWPSVGESGVMVLWFHVDVTLAAGF